MTALSRPYFTDFLTNSLLVYLVERWDWRCWSRCWRPRRSPAAGSGAQRGYLLMSWSVQLAPFEALFIPTYLMLFRQVNMLNELPASSAPSTSYSFCRSRSGPCAASSPASPIRTRGVGPGRRCTKPPGLQKDHLAVLRSGARRDLDFRLYHSLERISCTPPFHARRRSNITWPVRLAAFRRRSEGLGRDHGRVGAVHATGPDLLDRSTPHGWRPDSRGRERMSRQLAVVVDLRDALKEPWSAPPERSWAAWT